MVVISILWCKVKRLKKKLPKKGNVQQDVESEGSSRTETPASVRRGPASKNDQAQQPLLPSGAAEGAGEPSQPGDSDETERKCKNF